MSPSTSFLIAVLGLPFAFGADSPETRSWNILHESVNSTKVNTRQETAAALGSLGPSSEPVRLLENFLKDQDPDVRQTAASVLGQMKARQAIPALHQAMEDEDPGVAFFAVRALWEMGDLSGREELEEIVGKERAPAVGGVHRAVRSMKRTLRNPSQTAILGARLASSAILGPFSIGVTASVELLKDTGASGRALSAQMLAQHCDKETREVLEARMAAESSAAVKTAIARSLGECSDFASIPILDAYLNDSRNSIKVMSAAAIIRLTEPRPALK